MKTLVTGALVLSPDCESFDAADVVISNDRIETIGAVGSITRAGIDRIIDAKGLIAVPGFINAHGHSYAGLLKGSIDALPLDIYMLYAIAGGTARSPRAMYLSAMIDAVQMLKRGVTSFCDHYAQRPAQTVDGVEAGLQAYQDAGMRAVVAPMYSDKPFAQTVPFAAGKAPTPAVQPGAPAPQSPDGYLAVVEELIKRWNGTHSRLHVALGTDGPQRCTDPLLEKSRDLEAKYKAGWQTHLLEAQTQAIFARDTYGKPLVRHLVEDLHCINERTSLVHSVWLDDEEIDLVASTGATVVHCVRSNLHLGVGMAPVGTYRAKGIPVALGTDGANLGALDMLEVARFAALVHRIYERDYERWPDAASTLRMLYHGGARVIDRNPIQGGGLGVIQQGAKADLVFLKPNHIGWQPGQNLTRELLYYNSERAVHSVMVDGRLVVEDGTVRGVDEEALLAESIEVAERLGLIGPNAKAPSADEIALYREMYLENMESKIVENRFHG